MKRLLIILLMILMIFRISANDKELSITAEEWWLELSDQEQWEYFRKFYNNTVVLVETLKDNQIELEEAKKLIESNDNFLKKYKPKYLKWGVFFGWDVTLDNTLQVDLLIHLGFNIYVLQNKLSFSPKIIFKPYKDMGGGLGFNININF